FFLSRSVRTPSRPRGDRRRALRARRRGTERAPLHLPASRRRPARTLPLPILSPVAREAGLVRSLKPLGERAAQAREIEAHGPVALQGDLAHDLVCVLARSLRDAQRCAELCEGFL